MWRLRAAAAASGEGLLQQAARRSPVLRDNLLALWDNLLAAEVTHLYCGSPVPSVITPWRLLGPSPRPHERLRESPLPLTAGCLACVCVLLGV